MFSDDIKDFFTGKAKLEYDKDGQVSSQDLRIAVVVLMVALSRQDGDFCSGEGQKIARNLSNFFNVEAEASQNLIEQVKPLSKNFDNIETFVEAVKEKFSEEQRQLILAAIWSLAQADGVADRMETNFATVLRNRLDLTVEQAVRARQISEENNQDISVALNS